MNYDQQISNINNEIIEVKKKIKEVNEKTTNALITKKNELWREVIKDESSIIIAISNIKLTVYKLSIENPNKKSINNILGSYINLMKQSNIIRVGWSSLNWRINKIYDNYYNFIRNSYIVFPYLETKYNNIEKYSKYVN